ncbi:MAG: hypothetical protein KBT58_07945 [Bizionia sp.]|nr:hypothetical protein [Bizionia sp.]
MVAVMHHEGDMRLKWEINNDSLDKWREFVNANIANDFVKDRKSRNITRRKVDLSSERIWHVLVGCQVTTQQRSGPNSNVSKFLNSNSPALTYKTCLKHSDKKQFIYSELSNVGLRRSNVMADNLSKIIEYLESGGWRDLKSELETIQKNTTKLKERKVANNIAKTFPGLGPKQSRNFIQWLGLSRYEIPLDSRVTRTMKKLGCTFVPYASALSDLTVYYLIQEGLQEIAAKLEIYPCILDACIFSSFDV